MRKILSRAVCSLVFSIFLGGLLSVPADAADLVSLLTQKLGVTKDQAKGGTGAIFNSAEKKLSAEDFSKVKKAVPDMDNLQQAAPKAGGFSSLLGGGDLGNLTSSFSKLGLSPDMVGQFTPIILDYVESNGGAALRKILQGVLL